MKSSSSKKPKRASARDAQKREFGTRDLGDDLRAAGAGRVIRPKSHPNSIALEEDLVQQLRRKGAKRGLGYQAMLDLIVREHIGKY